MPHKSLIYKASYFYLLPDKGSNLDIQIQNLSYYHYTIGQWDGKTTKFSPYSLRRHLIFFQPFRKVNFLSWEKETLNTIEVPYTDLDMALFKYSGAFEGSTAFHKYPPRRIEHLIIGKTVFLDFGLHLTQDRLTHNLDSGAI
jgi:hypothetical protein